MPNGNEYYRRPHGSEFEQHLNLALDVMSKEQFQQLDERQEQYLSRVARLFPVDEQDEELKDFISLQLKARFKKGDRQFAAAGIPLHSYGRRIVRFQQDYRLGNTNTCAERLLLDAADEEGLTLAEMVTYRGENVEVDKGRLQSLQERGGKADSEKKNNMRHMVCACAYCREGLYHHNPTAMALMPPGILGVGKNTEKLPAFMIYPEDDLFEANDPLMEKIKDSPALKEARRMQKEFFGEIAKKYPLTDSDKLLAIEADAELKKQPLSDQPFTYIRARTTTDEIVKKFGEVEPPPKRYRYLDYRRNDVELRFIDEVLEVPHLPNEPDQTGSSHALHVYMELYREPRSSKSKIILPNADTRQRMVERFQRSFVLVRMYEKIVKLPFILFYPNRYKRFDKNTGRV